MKEHHFQVVGEYKNFTTPIKAICPKGHSCEARPRNIDQIISVFVSIIHAIANL